MERHALKDLVKVYDNTFTIVHEDKVEKMLDALNKVHRNLTPAVEVNGEQLPFLDLKIIRQEKRISFDIYIYSSSAERFLNEKKYIIDTGMKNGFQRSIIERLM